MLSIRKFLILLGFLTPILGCIADDSIIKNGDFSDLNAKQMPSGWFRGFPEKQGTWSLDDKVFNSAPGSLCISNTDAEQYSLYSQDITLKPDTDYKISFWMKGEAIDTDNPKNGAGLFIEDAKTQKFIIEGTSAGRWKRITGTFDWQKTEFLFNSGKAADARIGLVLYKSKGKVWFDSIRLEAVNAEKNTTELFPSELFPIDYQKGTYYLAGDFPGVLCFKCKGDKTKAGDLKLVFEIPEGCELSAASWFFPSGKDANGNAIYQNEKISTEKITADGKNYTRYIISLNKGFINQLAPDSTAWNNYERIYIKRNTQLAGSTEKAAVSYYTCNENWKSEVKKFDLYYLPALKKNPQPAKKFAMMICYMNSITAPLDNIRDEYLSYFCSLSSNAHTLNIFGWDNIAPELRKKMTDKFQVELFVASKYETPFLGFENWRKDFIAKNPASKLPPIVMDDGKETTISACPSFIISEPYTAPYWNDYIATKLAEKMKNINGKKIIYDIEPGAMTHCFCGTCQEEFKKFIAPETFSGIDEIKKKYSAKWFDFRVIQNNSTTSKLAEFLKMRFPEKEFWICSDPVHQKKALAEWCGFDVRLADKYSAGHMNMPYYEGLEFYNDMQLNMASLKQPNIPWIDPTEMMEMFYIRYTPEGVAQNIIASAALGCKGFGFWPFDFFDGRYLGHISNAFTTISKAEDYYFSGETATDVSASAANIYSQEFNDEGKKITATFPDFAESLKIHVNKKGDSRLVTLINYNKKFSAITKIAMQSAKDGEYTMTELDSGKVHSSEKGKAFISGKDLRDGALAEVAPGSYKVIEITPTKSGAAAVKNQEDVILQENLRVKLAAENTRMATLCQFSEKKSADGNSAISWGDPDKNKIPELKLSNGNNCVYAATEKGGGVISWREKSSGVSDDFVADKNYSGVIGNIVFYNDQNHGDRNNYSIKSLDITKDGAPLAILFNKFTPALNANAESNPLDGIEITKEIRLEKDGKELKMLFHIKNTSLSGAPLKTGFRIKNYAFTGSGLSGNEPPVKISSVSTTVGGSEKVVSGNFKSNNVFLAAGNSNLSFAGQIDAKPQEWTVSPIKITASAENHKRALCIIPDAKNTAGFYVWWSPTTGFTIELLSKDFTIPFGETVTYECIYNIEKQ